MNGNRFDLSPNAIGPITRLKNVGVNGKVSTRIETVRGSSRLGFLSERRSFQIVVSRTSGKSLATPERRTRIHGTVDDRRNHIRQEKIMIWSRPEAKHSGLAQRVHELEEGMKRGHCIMRHRTWHQSHTNMHSPVIFQKTLDAIFE